MHIRIKGRITVSGYLKLMAALRETAPKEEPAKDPFDILNDDLRGQRIGYLTLDNGTILGITAYVGEKRVVKLTEDPTHFRIEGSFKFTRAGEIEPIIIAVPAEEWTPDDGDELGPLIRNERQLQVGASRRPSTWPRPSSRPRSDPPKPAPTS